MKKLLFVVFFVLMVSLLTACQQTASVETQDAAELAAASNEAAIKQAIAATQTAMAVQATPTLTLTPEEETPVPTFTPTATPVAFLQLKTAEDVRVFFTDIEGWVSGGDAGQWTAGAQGVLAKDLILRNMPEGMVFEFECVQYSNLGNELISKKVCPDAEIRFSEVIPAGAFGTLWLEWAVQGSDDELWKEGFVNKPCICPDGDCRE